MVHDEEPSDGPVADSGTAPESGQPTALDRTGEFAAAADVPGDDPDAENAEGENPEDEPVEPMSGQLLGTGEAPVPPGSGQPLPDLPQLDQPVLDQAQPDRPQPELPAVSEPLAAEPPEPAAPPVATRRRRRASAPAGPPAVHQDEPAAGPTGSEPVAAVAPAGAASAGAGEHSPAEQAAAEPAATAQPAAEPDAVAPPARAPRKRTSRKKAAAAAPDAGEVGELPPGAGLQPFAAGTRPEAAAEPAAPAAEGEPTEPAAPTRRRRARKSAAAAQAPAAETGSVPAEAPGTAEGARTAGTAPVSDADQGAGTATAGAGEAAQPSAALAEAAPADPAATWSSALPFTMPLFQAPEPVVTPPRRPRRASSRPAGPPVPLDLDEDEQDLAERAEAIDDAEDALDDEAAEAVDAGDEIEDDEGGEPGRRRRRRRGGRGRRGRSRAEGDAAESADAAEGSEEDAEADDDTEDEAEDAEAGAGGEDQGELSSGSRRRRRRRRRGSASADGEPGPDDPPNTVVKVRESRRSGGGGGGGEDVLAVRGSTRLEAKKQRRREGREAGRRRPVITEAEFLARRESVERVMLVREREGRTQIGVLEDGVLVEHYVARRTQSSTVGNVYLGKVQNVLPSMEAAFVDVGKGRNAVLYAGEVNWDAAGMEGQPKRIEHALKSGEAVLVQVTKDPIGHKGARLTSQISLPGRYLVYVPDGSMTGISRKLPDTERARLKKILRAIVPDDAGVIVRTAAEGASAEELERDVARLRAQWEDIAAKASAVNAPALLYGEPDLAIRVVRDIFNEDFGKLVVSGDEAWDTLQAYIGHVAPDLVSRIERWTGDQDIFAAHRIDEQLAKALDRKVWLPSGGSLVIDRTEAMTVIDVNTGKFTGAGGNLEETVTKNNLEAAEEIVRQLRVRDIGGIIVVDFIDMVLESNRELVLRRLLECLGRDRTKHQVAEVTSLGLVQMTRKRVGQGLLEVFSETCEHCGGRGIIVHDEPVEKKQDPGSGGGRTTGTSGSGSSRSGRSGRGRGGSGRGGDQSGGDDQAAGSNGVHAGAATAAGAGMAQATPAAGS